MSYVNEQLDDIHAMLVNGQRSVRVESHTWYLWGLTGFFIILIHDLIITPINFEMEWHEGVVSSLFFAVMLFLVGLVDFLLTQRARRQRDESLPFVHRQLRKIVYLLFGLIVATYMGVTILDGSDLSIGIYFSLIGLGFYVYGLFSEQILTWIGVLLIILGTICVGIKLTHLAASCLFASVLGIGFPAMALMLDKPGLHNNNKKRILMSFVWILLVIIPATLAYKIVLDNPVELPELSLKEYMNQPANYNDQIIQFQKGTEVPIRIHLRGNAFEELVTTTISPLMTSQAGEVLVENEKLVRLLPNDRSLWDKRPHIRIWAGLVASLTHEEGPSLDYTLFYSVYY